MKILNVINSMNPTTGGPCEGIRNLIPELKRKGIDSEVVCLDDPHNSYLKNDSFTVYALGKSLTPWKYHPRLFSWLLINLTRYDIVIVRGLWLYHSYAVHKAIRTLRKKNIKRLPRVYIMPHGMLDPWFQQTASRKMKSIRNLLYWHLIEKKVVSCADGLLFTCLSELELARKTFSDYDTKKEINIGYGIDDPPVYNDRILNAFHERCPNLANQSFLLFLGRIDAKKAVHLLLNAYHKISQTTPNLPALIIAGPGLETEYGQKIFRMAEQSSLLDKKIIFPGMLTSDAKWGAFYECDAFILPSHQENFGIAVVEAMACGKAVLISNKVNIYKDIETARAGLVNEDSEAGISSLFNTWVGMTADKKNEMCRRARQVFETRFNIRSAALQMIQSLDL